MRNPPANAVDADGKVTDELLGSGVRTLRTYDPKTGLLTAINSGPGTSVVQHLSYVYDSLGNLRERHDNNVTRGIEHLQQTNGS